MKSPKSEENAPCRRELGDGLVLKTAVSEEDIVTAESVFREFLRDRGQKYTGERKAMPQRQ